MDESMHGGRVWAAARDLGVPPEAILDFSANLNPLGPPPSVVGVLRENLPRALTAYPDAEAPRLRKLLSEHHDAPDGTLVMGAGGASLLFLALRALSPRRVLVPLPCFREQPRALEAAGAELVPFPMPDLMLDLEKVHPALAGCDGVLLTNPHNPTGALVPRREMETWVRRHPGTAIIVDEAFMDYVPGESLLPEILKRPRTVVLRSLSKFYAMPGLRVGHAFADEVTAYRMATLQESWPVGQLELLAAEAALLDLDYAKRSLIFFKEEGSRFRGALEDLGVTVYPSAAPFFLVKLPRPIGLEWAAALARQGILVRTCARWPGLGDRFLRLALRPRADQDRLLAALRDLW